MLLRELESAYTPRIDPGRLLQILEEIKDGELLLDDEVLRIYSSAIAAFSVDELVALTHLWPTEFEETNLLTAKAFKQFSDIALVFRRRDDPQQILDFLAAIPSDHKFRNEMLYKVAQSMKMFSPSEISHYLEHFPDEDQREIARGIVARIRNSGSNDANRVELLREYLEEIRDPSVIAPLVSLHLEMTAKSDPQAVLDWVRDQDPGLAASWDEPVIRALVKDYPVQAADYVNEILATHEKARADKALEYMIREYSIIDPAGALDWVIALPKEVEINQQMIADPFIQLIKSDPEHAKRVMETTRDPKLKSLLMRFWENQNRLAN